MSETREDVLRRGIELAQHLPEGTIHRAMADEIRRLESLLRGTLCAIEDTEADRADEILRLRDEARGVRALEHLMRGDNLAVKWDALSGAFFLSTEAEIGEDTLAALGLELLKRGRVTL